MNKLYKILGAGVLGLQSMMSAAEPVFGEEKEQKYLVVHGTIVGRVDDKDKQNYFLLVKDGNETRTVEIKAADSSEKKKFYDSVHLNDKVDLLLNADDVGRVYQVPTEKITVVTCVKK